MRGRRLKLANEIAMRHYRAIHGEDEVDSRLLGIYRKTRWNRKRAAAKTADILNMTNQTMTTGPRTLADMQEAA